MLTMEDESMLKIIFEVREEELAAITKEDKIFMKENNISRNQKCSYLLEGDFLTKRYLSIKYYRFRK